jgi:hypothetical protein
VTFRPAQWLCGLVLCAMAPAACAWLGERPVQPHAPFFAQDSHDAKALPIVARQADEFLTGCAESHNCDRAHFIRALVALYEDRSVAVRHFQEVISAAPSSERASSSLFWLRLLREPRTDSSPDSQLGRAADRLVRDLLDRELLVLQLSREIEASPVRSLQRELKTRDKKVEELTGQLEALKKIDREIREKTLPKKPPHNKPAP